jgi:hypothetical protein
MNLPSFKLKNLIGTPLGEKGPLPSKQVVPSQQSAGAAKHMTPLQTKIIFAQAYLYPILIIIIISSFTRVIAIAALQP